MTQFFGSYFLWIGIALVCLRVVPFFVRGAEYKIATAFWLSVAALAFLFHTLYGVASVSYSFGSLAGLVVGVLISILLFK